MTVQSPDYGNPAAAIPEIWRRLMRNVHTAMPGIVESYDPVSRRARVQPAIDILLADGSVTSRPIITGVPVLWPMTGMFSLTAPLASGDNVLLIISERGLERWKIEHGKSPPGTGVFALRDCMAIPGLGPLGSHTPTHRIDVTAGGIDITAPTVTINGQRAAQAAAGTGTALSGAEEHAHTLTEA